MFKFEQITPLNLHSVWQQVLPGLEQVRVKAEPEWWPEDVYMVLKTGTASLYMCYLDSVYAGFFILVPKQDDYSGKRSLLIWIAHSTGLFDAVNAALPEIYKIAKQHGMSSVCLHSPRVAWGRRLAREGFKVSEIKFEREV